MASLLSLGLLLICSVWRISYNDTLIRRPTFLAVILVLFVALFFLPAKVQPKAK